MSFRLPFSGRLGLKLMASGAVLLLLLAAATAWLIGRGFEQTRANALVRARAGLEAQARASLAQLASSEARLTWANLEQAATVSRVGARSLGKLLEEQQGRVVPRHRLARLPGGQRYDPNPERASEVFIPSFVTPGSALDADTAASDLLDPLLPALYAQVDDAVAVYFVGLSGATRYHPVRDIHEMVPADLDIRKQEQFRNAVPSRNPGLATVWTSPYLDDAGTGLLITAATPVLIGTEFRGIVAVDVSLNRLAARLEQIQP
ncbi:MAG TPA: cache domain-containing protein, partial [Deinococcales bacterium]|nr:cache domain-containing protein [Deinococcales bacterium]